MLCRRDWNAEECGEVTYDVQEVPKHRHDVAVRMHDLGSKALQR